MKRELICLIYFLKVVLNTRSSMLVMFIIKALVENWIFDITRVILEITFDNYTVSQEFLKIVGSLLQVIQLEHS